MFAIMDQVQDPLRKIRDNLMVDVKSTDRIGLDIGMYDVSLDLGNPHIITSNANGFPLWWYFQFSGRRSSELRNRYFDIVRALDLKEMWFMWEDLTDYFDPYEDDLQTILKTMTAPRRPDEFSNRDYNEFDLEELLRQEPYGDEVYPYGMFYHDTFKDLFRQVEEIENRENIIVLGLTEFESGMIRVLRPDGTVDQLIIR
ncbi:MAG: hypothetical protein Q4B16_09000 [Bacteroidia bacterium]|nr:hypothetical protein [Bacteroidia bacterium]